MQLTCWLRGSHLKEASRGGAKHRNEGVKLELSSRRPPTGSAGKTSAEPRRCTAVRSDSYEPI